MTESTPHDLYGSTDSGEGAWPRQAGGPIASVSAILRIRARGTASIQGRTGSIRITFSTPQVSSPPAYAVTYRYAPQPKRLSAVAGRNTVRRSADRAQQIAARNVLVLDRAGVAYSE